MPNSIIEKNIDRISSWWMYEKSRRGLRVIKRIQTFLCFSVFDRKLIWNAHSVFDLEPYGSLIFLISYWIPMVYIILLWPSKFMNCGAVWIGIGLIFQGFQIQRSQPSQKCQRMYSFHLSRIRKFYSGFKFTKFYDYHF